MNTIKLSYPELSPVIWKCIIENKRDGTGLFSHSRETSLEFPQIVDELSNYYRDLDNYMSKMDYKTGSISLLGGIMLYMLMKYFQPRKVFEVGTLIGKSTVAMALGISQYCDDGIIYTCDKDNDFYLDELKLECEVRGMGKTLSTEALKKVSEKEDSVDLFFFDGSLQDSDLKYIAQLSGENTILAVDDFEGISKGVINFLALKQLPCFRSYILVHPCPVGLLDFVHSYGSRSVIALLVPQTIFRVTQG